MTRKSQKGHLFRQTGFAWFFLILAVVGGLIVGVAGVEGLLGLFQEQHKPRTQRRSGSADARLYPETIKGKDATDGVSVKMTLKKGIDVYLIVPPGGNGTYAEVGEFSELPLSPGQLPLYTDFGYGINVAFKIKGKNTLNEPAYLVFDFSKGRVLKKLQKKNHGINRCDYSTVYFIPGVCAALLKTPAEKTLNPRYTAVNSVFPLYSYYLGFDDLLVVRVDRNAVIIPQPLTKELAADLIESTFKNYPREHEAYEAMDILGHFKGQVSNQRVPADIVQKFQSTDFKQLYAAPYILDLSQKADTEAVKNEMSKKYEIRIQNLLDKLYENAVNNNGLLAIEANANLKRAYDAKIKGSAQKSLQAVNKVVSNLNNKSYSSAKITPVIEGAAILLGKNSRSLGKENTRLGFTRVLGVTTDIPQDTGGDRQAFEDGAESSWGDVVASAQARYNEILAKPNPTAAELLEAAQLAEQILRLDENIVDDLLDRARKRAMEDVKNAKDDESFKRAAYACEALGGSEAECGREKVEKMMQTPTPEVGCILPYEVAADAYLQTCHPCYEVYNVITKQKIRDRVCKSEVWDLDTCWNWDIVSYEAEGLKSCYKFWGTGELGEREIPLEPLTPGGQQEPPLEPLNP